MLKRLQSFLKIRRKRPYFTSDDYDSRLVFSITLIESALSVTKSKPMGEMKQLLLRPGRYFGFISVGDIT